MTLRSECENMACKQGYLMFPKEFNSHYGYVIQKGKFSAAFPTLHELKSFLDISAREIKTPIPEKLRASEIFGMKKRMITL